MYRCGPLPERGYPFYLGIVGGYISIEAEFVRLFDQTRIWGRPKMQSERRVERVTVKLDMCSEHLGCMTQEGLPLRRRHVFFGPTAWTYVKDVLDDQAPSPSRV
jgi:hypothetical protein